MADVLVPADLWNASDSAAISTWLYSDGDAVAEGAVIAEIMVEKSSYELLAPISGSLHISVKAETPVTAGDIVAQII